MKNLINITLVALVALFAASSSRAAQGQKYVGANGSVALRIYNGYTGDVSLTVANAGTSVVVVADGITNTITTGTNVSLLGSALAAVTNSSGQAYLIVDSGQSLPSDTCIGGLLTASAATVKPGKWGYIYWNTALCKFYQVSWPSGVWFARNSSVTLTDPDRPDSGAFNITSIYGSPAGTGTVTVAAYIGTNQVYGKTYVSPTGYGAGLTNITEVVDVNIGNGVAPVVVAPQGQPVIIRATRATSAGSGNLGVITTGVGY